MSSTSDNASINWIAGFIWGIADDVLRDLYVRGKYRDVILPMTVLLRLDTLLEPTKSSVLAMRDTLDKAGIVNQEAALRDAAGLPFYNTSRFSLNDLRNRGSQQQLKADFEDWLDGWVREEHVLASSLGEDRLAGDPPRRVPVEARLGQAVGGGVARDAKSRACR